MTINNQTLYQNNFDGTGPLPAPLQAWGQYDSTEVDSETAFGVVDGRLSLVAGFGSQGLKVAMLPASLFGSSNYAVEIEVDESAGSAFMGISARMSTPVGAAVDCYLLGRWGSKAFINRVTNGVQQDPPLLDLYTNALDNEPAPHRLRLEVDSNGGGDPVLRVMLWRTTTGAFEQIGEVIDSSASKITTAGTLGFATVTYYDPERLKFWDNALVVGTAAAGAERWGVRLTDLRGPNTDAPVADATGVRVIVRDAIGGTELLDAADGEIAGGEFEYEYGAGAGTVDVELRWAVSGEPRFYAETVNLADLDA